MLTQVLTADRVKAPADSQSKGEAMPEGAASAGLFCALVIGLRKASTDTKTSLNDALREFGVAV